MTAWSLLYVTVSPPPTPAMEITTTAIMAQISPYSIAVAPRSSDQKRLIGRYSDTLSLSSQKISEVADQRLVRRGHRKIAKPVRPDPFDVLGFPGHRRPFPPSADEKWQ